MKEILLQWLNLCGLRAEIETFPSGTSFQFPENKILFLVSGILHLETMAEQKKIITYLNSQYLLNLEHLLRNQTSKYALTSDTQIKVIQINQQDFHKLIKEKPSFIEWLLTSNAEIAAKMITEFSKKHEDPFSKIQDSLITLYKDKIIEPVPPASNWIQLPSFMTRTDLAYYCQVSRKTLQVEFKKMQQKKLLKFEAKEAFLHHSLFKKNDN